MTGIGVVMSLAILFGLVVPLSVLIWSDALKEIREWKAERAVRRMQKEAAKSAAWRDAR